MKKEKIRERLGTEDLWDFICSQVGFDENGKETQEAIRRFVRLKLKEYICNLF